MRTIVKGTLIACLSLLATVSLAADDDDVKKAKKALKPVAEYEQMKRYKATGKVVHDISLSRVDRTRVLDDNTILFIMHGKKAYVNRMKYKCHGLKREDRFSYETHAGRLTSLDTISVLDSFGRRWASCGLDDFVEYKRIPKPKKGS